jgi:hypothetical protein
MFQCFLEIMGDRRVRRSFFEEFVEAGSPYTEWKAEETYGKFVRYPRESDYRRDVFA